MNIENQVFLALYNEYEKDIPNMDSITPNILNISNDEFNIALQKLEAKHIITGLKSSKGANGKIILAYLESVQLTEKAYEYYKNITFANEKKIISKLSDNRPNKIFISHSSKDIKYVKLFVQLLESIGLPEDRLFCSSVPGYGVPNEEYIYDYLLKQFYEYNLKIYYILSKNYYDSPASLNEMGAAWLLKSSNFSILLPNFTFDEMRGVVSSSKISLKLDADIDEVKSRLNGLKDDLISLFDLRPLSAEKWERLRNIFIQDILNLSQESATAQIINSPF